MTEQAGKLTRRQVLDLLTRAPHASTGRARAEHVPLAEKLRQTYAAVGQQAASEDPSFFGHLVAWNAAHGTVRDAKIALPTLALATSTALTLDPRYVENALAHLGTADIRDLVLRGIPFAKLLHVHKKTLKRFAVRYVREFEAHPQFHRRALLHHRSLRVLYERFHIAPAEHARPYTHSKVAGAVAAIGPLQRYLAALRALRTADTPEVGRLIREAALPWLAIGGALRPRFKDDKDLLAVVLMNLTAEELTHNAQAFQRLGLGDARWPQLREAYDRALRRKAAGVPKRGGGLKATKAAETLAEAGHAELAQTVRQAQEITLDAMKQARGIEGDWLVFCDISGSMKGAIEPSRKIAALCARLTKGKVVLIFGDTDVEVFDVTGLSYQDIRQQTAHITDRGGTSLGCGLDYLLKQNVAVEGIAIISDGGENQPPYFSAVYARYAARFDREPTVYWYQIGGARYAITRTWGDTLKAAGIDVQTFDISGGVDDAALPNLVQTMRVNRYSLVDEVLQTPLLTLDQAMPRTAGMRVLPVRAEVPTILVEE
jgi:hypothetical protein